MVFCCVFLAVHLSLTHTSETLSFFSLKFTGSVSLLFCFHSAIEGKGRIRESFNGSRRHMFAIQTNVPVWMVVSPHPIRMQRRGVSPIMNWTRFAAGAFMGDVCIPLWTRWVPLSWESDEERFKNYPISCGLASSALAFPLRLCEETWRSSAQLFQKHIFPQLRYVFEYGPLEHSEGKCTESQARGVTYLWVKILAP